MTDQPTEDHEDSYGSFASNYSEPWKELGEKQARKPTEYVTPSNRCDGPKK